MWALTLIQQNFAFTAGLKNLSTNTEWVFFAPLIDF